MYGDFAGSQWNVRNREVSKYGEVWLYVQITAYNRLHAKPEPMKIVKLNNYDGYVSEILAKLQGI